MELIRDDKDDKDVKNFQPEPPQHISNICDKNCTAVSSGKSTLLIMIMNCSSFSPDRVQK